MMIEPVAYYKDYNDGTTLYFRGSSLTETDKRDPLIKPLYEEEQLHPLVKMTQKQYDRLMWDKQNSDLFQCIDYFTNHDGGIRFGLQSENLMGDLTQEDVARAWLNPEETIEIVSNMKWFIETKNMTSDYRFFKIDFENKSVYNNSLKIYASSFETKAQAESWVTPLTKAVQLPVEE